MRNPDRLSGAYVAVSVGPCFRNVLDRATDSIEDALRREGRDPTEIRRRIEAQIKDFKNASSEITVSTAPELE